LAGGGNGRKGPSTFKCSKPSEDGNGNSIVYQWQETLPFCGDPHFTSANRRRTRNAAHAFSL
jgi:hypothetical protein